MAQVMSARTVGRLTLYRRVLKGLKDSGQRHVVSQALAELAGVTAVQVRRDLMGIGGLGSNSRGYDVECLLERIIGVIEPVVAQQVALVGLGNLGRALLTYFPVRRPRLRIVAAFDSDPAKSGRVICGCPCHDVRELESLVRGHGISLGIITVPGGAAQGMAERLASAGVRGILNFTPRPLRLPADVYVEDIDITMSLDKVAYYSRQDNVVV